MESMVHSVDTAETLPEILRIRVPSPIGALGLELQGLAVLKLLVAPKPAALAEFAPLGKAACSDFVEEVVGRLAEYFAGARKRLELEIDAALVDLDPFVRRVLREACRVSYGKTRTYRDLADMVGRGDDVEAVREALLANPIPVLVPCHRFVVGSGKIGAWTGGSDRKKWLLALERDGAEAI